MAVRQAFQLNQTLYQHDFKIYTTEREAIDKLRNWVLKTVSDYLFRTSCDLEDTLKGWYTKLKEQVGVSATKQKRDARSLYKEANKPLTKAPRDAIAQLNTWEEAITLVKEKKVLEAQQLDIQFEDFCNSWRAGGQLASRRAAGGIAIQWRSSGVEGDKWYILISAVLGVAKKLKLALRRRS